SLKCESHVSWLEREFFICASRRGPRVASFPIIRSKSGRGSSSYSRRFTSFALRGPSDYRNWTKPLRGISRSTNISTQTARVGEAGACLPLRTPMRKHGMAACSTFHFAKELFHDIPSATHDRRHAGAESRAQHANLLRATGVPVRAALRQITGTIGP